MFVDQHYLGAAAVGGILPRQSDTELATDNTDDLPHVDLGPELNTIFWLLTSLAFAFLALRVYCKFLRGRRLWWDDYVLIAAWISLVACAATTSACVALDYGKHFHDMAPENVPTMRFVAVFAGFFSVFAASLSKTSFALTLMRLSHGWLRFAICVIMVTINIVLGSAMISMWAKCTPVQKIWIDEVEGTCISGETIVVFYQFTAGYSGAMDVILALVPWPLIWKITMGKKEKFGVAIAMSMGVVAGVTSFVKMIMLPNLTGDPTESVAVTIWGGAEGAITIMAASIPVLRMLFRGNNGQSPAQFATIDEQRLNAVMNLETLETFDTKNSQGLEATSYGCTAPLPPPPPSTPPPPPPKDNVVK
ncbi:96ca82bc-67f3-4b3a-ab36-ffe7d8f40fbe [Cladorrhinum sp. PSN332]|nr:96ca82bc-67f3-4b3a-ab36-ffe7d8f40fbe [Cladorrhinum sp. PSN332]